MQKDEAISLTDDSDTVLRVLALSWLDADAYRSVKQNAGQRKSLIESAIAEYRDLRQVAKVPAGSERISGRDIGRDVH